MKNIENKMQKINFSFVLFILVFTLLFSGCKYDDGPIISIRSKQARVVNSWAYDLVLHNGLDVTGGSSELSVDYTQSSIGFNKDGRFSTIISEINADSTIVSTQYDGSWFFKDKKNLIELVFDSPFPPSGDTKDLVITKLKEKQLWLEEVQGVNLVEYRLNPTR